MKLFTVDEANELLPLVKVKLEAVRTAYARAELYQAGAKAAAEAANAGGGMEGGSRYVRALYEIGKTVTDLNEMGIQLKDHHRGLIDFPSDRDGRVVLLCWQLGEPEQIEWWHELEAGFAGRQPL
jgi:hypothetical protein